MAGHSKWANIKHRKAAQDAKRGKVFTKIIRELVVAAKFGGGEVNDNPRLRAAVDKALGANMKRDTIDKAIARGIGAGEGDNYEELSYEGYGPAGVAFLLDVMTDNRNRSVADIRHAFSKHGGNLGTDGSVAYLFTKVGLLCYPPETDEDALIEAALNAGADDIVTHDDGSIDVYTAWEEFHAVQQALVAADFEPANAELTQVASTMVDLGLDDAETTLRLIDMLEDLDDVQNVYTNANIDSELLFEAGI